MADAQDLKLRKRHFLRATYRCFVPHKTLEFIGRNQCFALLTWVAIQTAKVAQKVAQLICEGFKPEGCFQKNKTMKNGENMKTITVKLTLPEADVALIERVAGEQDSTTDAVVSEIVGKGDALPNYANGLSLVLD